MDKLSSELLKLSSACILVKAAAPDFINKILGRPTSRQSQTMDLIKTILPIAGTLGLGFFGNQEAEESPEETFAQLQELLSDPEIQKMLDSSSRIL